MGLNAHCNVFGRRTTDYGRRQGHRGGRDEKGWSLTGLWGFDIVGA